MVMGASAVVGMLLEHRGVCFRSIGCQPTVMKLMSLKHRAEVEKTSPSMTS